MVWPAAGAGPVSLLLPDPGIGLARLAPCRRHGAADLKASPLPPAPCLVAAASLFGRSDNLGIILVSFFGPVGIIWRPLGTSVGHLGEKFTLWGAMY